MLVCSRPLIAFDRYAGQVRLHPGRSYIDSSHDAEGTILEVEAWRPALGAGSLVVFDDFAHPGYPGVEQAVRRLGLPGERRGGLFVHRVG